MASRFSSRHPPDARARVHVPLLRGLYRALALGLFEHQGSIVVNVPETRFAMTRGGAHIAYRSIGIGPPTVVFIPPWTSSVELDVDDPYVGSTIQRGASIGRFVSYDKRGTDDRPRRRGMVRDAVTVRRTAPRLRGPVDAPTSACPTKVCVRRCSRACSSSRSRRRRADRRSKRIALAISHELVRSESSMASVGPRAARRGISEAQYQPPNRNLRDLAALGSARRLRRDARHRPLDPRRSPGRP
jgi:hypothetical protein